MNSGNTKLIMIIFAGGICSIVAVCLIIPQYFLSQGMPLDDAWIHLVYGREFSKSFTLAYNPGHPSTGATSPLWAVLLAIPHLLFGTEIEYILVFTKFMGFLFHVASAVLFFVGVTENKIVSRWPAFVGTMILVLHPDLVAASLSGMEVSLTVFLLAAWIWMFLKGRLWGCAILAALCFLARPETVLFIGVFSVLRIVSKVRKDGLNFLQVKLFASSIFGAISAFCVLAVRNWLVSGFVLPATFYAKVLSPSGDSRLLAMLNGYGDFFQYIVILDATVVVLTIVLWSGYQWIQLLRKKVSHWASSSLLLAGLLWCLSSFYLIPFYFGDVFYHQRYILPGVFFILGVLPVFWKRIVASIVRSKNVRLFIHIGAGFFCLFSMALDYPTRFNRLSNDAQNIDDVQVKEGKYLSKLADDSVTWVVDAGATRYFGNGFMVDLWALNSFELLTDEKDTFLGKHQPDVIQIVPRWNALEGGIPKAATIVAVAPTTEYTVTAISVMKTHILLKCDLNDIKAGTIRTFFDVRYSFVCASRSD